MRSGRSHEVETILDLARNGALQITTAVIDRILESKDYLNGCLTELESMLQTGKLPAPPNNAALIEGIRRLNKDAGKPAETPPPVESATEGLLQLASKLSGTSEPPAHTAGLRAPDNPEAVKVTETKSAAARSIKVDTGKLDYLVDMVGEMVIAQSLVKHDPDLATVSKPRLARNLSQLARITDDVQRTAMSMRMIPIGQLFQKTGRLVRDLSRKYGKHVDLDMQGEDTELDRNIVEELADPLMHMVRNAIDHGIEMPEERARAGKPATARLTLKAGHQAGHIVIQVSDDGQGLDKEKILRRACQKNLIPAGTELTESEIFNLIFQPGFSTAEKVTEISGRGVGMDVVRKHVQKLRGRVDASSVRGQGTSFLMKLPLTLAIIDGLVVGVGKQRYIVPIFAVREMLKPAEDAISTVQGKHEMAMVRGALLPVIRLHQRFNLKPRFDKPWESLLIVSGSEGHRFCLMVDELIGKQEVVIKSLGETMQNIPGVAGGAILGDGRVGLILDLEGLFGANHSE
jgi:two-component system chemotaxis sensor kinase CheA